MQTISQNHPIRQPASWAEAAAGLLPVLTLSMATTLEGIGSQSFLAAPLVVLFILLLYALPVTAIPLAFQRLLPRWSAPYFALLLLDFLLLPPIFSTQLLEGFWALLFLRLAVVLLLLFFAYRLLLLIRKSPPLASPAGLGWVDILFAVHALTPFLVMGLFDEIAVAYKTPFMLLAGCLLALGALLYLRLRSQWLALAALLASALLALLLSDLLADLYWGAHPWG